MRPFAAFLGNLSTNPVFWSEESDRHIEIEAEHRLRMTEAQRVVEVHFYPNPDDELPDPMTWVVNYTYLGKTRRPEWIDAEREYEFKRKLAAIVTKFVSTSGTQTVTVRGWAFGGDQDVQSGIGYAYKNTTQRVFGGTGYAFDQCEQIVRGEGGNAYAHDEVKQSRRILLLSNHQGTVQHFGNTRKT